MLLTFYILIIDNKYISTINTHKFIMKGDIMTENNINPILTNREVEVLSLLAEGFVYPEIAEKLGVKRNTVKVYCKSIYQKLGARNKTHAVFVAVNKNLLPV